MLIRESLRTFVTWQGDSERWNAYRPRAGDVIVCTYPKCGTTWVQQIVVSLIHQEPHVDGVTRIAPWFDARNAGPVDEMMAQLDAQPHRRSIKAHQGINAMPLYDEVKYINVGRSGPDVALSYHHHLMGMTQRAAERFDQIGLSDPRLNAPVPRPAADAAEFFRDWLDPAALGFMASEYFAIARSFWAERALPNVLMVHYNDLKADLDGEMKRIAAFLEIETPAALWPKLVEAATFDAMQERGEKIHPNVVNFEGGKLRFFNKGTNERWRGLFRDEDVAFYQQRLATETSAGLTHWIAHGRNGGDPRTAAD